MPTQTSIHRETNADAFSIEEAFRQSEASVALEGINPMDYPIYAELRNRVIAGEITSDEMTDRLVAQFSQKQTSAAA